MADGMRWAGRLFDASGTAINAATVNLYDVGTVTPVRATTTSNSTGDWEIDHATRGLFDIEVVNGAATRRIVQDSEVQFKSAWLWNADANEYAFGVTRTEDVASVEIAYFEGDRLNPADNDLAYISLRLSDSAGTQREGARIEWQGTTVLAGATGDTDLVLYALANNVLTEMVRLDGSASVVVIPTLNITSFGANWTNASRTVADLGIVTTVDINGGTVDGVTVATSRVNPRTGTVTSSGTPTINTDNVDVFTITALAVAITSMTTNLSGTPVNGQKLIVRILDNGTARAITWGASFVARGVALPTTTTANKYLRAGFEYNSTAAVWDCIATAEEA